MIKHICIFTDDTDELYPLKKVDLIEKRLSHEITRTTLFKLIQSFIRKTSIEPLSVRA